MRIAGREVRVGLAGGMLCYALIENDAKAVLFSRLETLESVFRGHTARRTLAAQENFWRARRALAGQRGAAPDAWAFTRQPGPMLQLPASTALVELRVSPSMLETRAWLSGGASFSQILSQAIGETGAGGRLHHPITDNLSARLAWSDLGGALRFIDRSVPAGARRALFDEDAAGMARYRGVFDALLEAPEINNLSVSVVGVANSVPELVLRTDMEADAAARFIRTVQVGETGARDRAILARAVYEYEANGDQRPPLADTGWLDGANARLLASRNLIEPQGGDVDWTRSFRADFDRTLSAYRGCLDPAATLSAEGCSRGGAYAYLLPAATIDDVKLLERRAGVTLTEEERRSIIQENRYRLAATYDAPSRTLWIGADLGVLRRAMAAQREGVAPDPPAIPGAERRLIVRFEPGWLNNQLRLQGQTESSDNSVFLTSYSSVAVSMNALRNDRGVIVNVVASR
ncbi:MAG: hypothetical protein HXY28_09365 [Hydrogenophilaceae bacterium]|jgi:hypothetical protein|nr:hypothetical protein [Hydrogenophilaceae bacterium]